MTKDQDRIDEQLEIVRALNTLIVASVESRDKKLQWCYTDPARATFRSLRPVLAKELLKLEKMLYD